MKGSQLNTLQAKRPLAHRTGKQSKQPPADSSRVNSDLLLTAIQFNKFKNIVREKVGPFQTFQIQSERSNRLVSSIAGFFLFL